MKLEHLLTVLKRCAGLLPEDLSVERADTSKTLVPLMSSAVRSVVSEHLLWMIEELAGTARREISFHPDTPASPKDERWLGFIQGALWVLGLASIDEFRAMNREDVKPQSEDGTR